ncbi:MAG: TonB-dependent receptor [Proteobacteria bacterium]|jgi:iron complex outermembrane recepter protein|nr:TonB-dependent receptor [Pseudomonadota bacterium]MDA0953416.1 TonB-dependent receptor [Pseudomonadota bacterium]
MKTLRPTSLCLILGFSVYTSAQSSLEEIIVTAEHGSTPLLQTASSVTVLGVDDLRQGGIAHFEDLLRQIPNVTASSGASRSRFFQIRGIGERSQYQEPVNPSVGLLIDGVDYSGLGLTASTLDIEQVEVLRGPQGTLHGANALAGLIVMRSHAPDQTAANTLSFGSGNYGTRAAHWISNGELNENMRYRLVLGHNVSDGYIDNTYLGRSDTNNIDERQIRLRVSWHRDDSLTEAGWSQLDADNGFDAFSLDNSRKTLSDQPGSDQQTTDTLWLRHTQDIGQFETQIQLNSARSSTLYSFDEDWSYVGIAPGFEYSSFDQYARDYDSVEADWSLAYRPDTGDSQWLLGLYHRRNQERLDRNYTYLAEPFSSDYQTDYTAFYGQWDYQITPTVEAQIGARYEARDADYSDNAQLQNSTDDGFTSGKLALQWQLNDTHRVYLAMSRGYRAGGVNSAVLASMATALTTSERERLQQQQVFDAETLWNTELGLRSVWPESGITWMTTVFVMDRSDQQVKGSLVLPRADGSTQFIDYINNAAESYNRGLESELRWTLHPTLTMTGSVGILNAKFDRYINADGRDLAGRDQAQAPRFQYAASVHWQPAPHWTIAADLEARDGHYFSDRHETGSDRFERVNTSLTYAMNQWRLVAWAKNVTDQTVAVRGFGSFGNDPRACLVDLSQCYATESYYQFDAPRTFGVSVDYTF